jgi:hypothetical protein
LPEYPAEPTQSTVTVEAVDTLGVWQRTALKPYPRRMVEAQVDAFYPLTESNARGGGADVKGSFSDFTVYVASTGGSCDFASDNTFSDASEPCVAMTSGRGLHASVALPNLAFSMGGLFKLAAGSAGTVVKIPDVFTVSWDGAGTLTATLFTGGGGIPTISNVSPDTWHYIGMTRDANLVVDGTFRVDGVTTALSASRTGNLTGATYIVLGSDLTMSVRDVHIMASSVTTPPLFADDYGRAVGLAANTLGGSSSVRADLGLTFTTDPTTVAASGTELTGMTLFDAALIAADSQAGVVYCTYTSTAATPTALANADARPTTVALTIDAEGDMDGGPSMARGLIEVVGEVTVRSPSASYRVISGTGAFGATTVEVMTYLSATNDLYAVASDRIAAAQYARLRVSALTLDLISSSTDRYTAFFAVTPGERVRLSGLPTGSFGLSYIDSYVDGWTERGTPDEYMVTFALSPADAPPEAVLDDTTYSRIPWGDGVCTLTSGITSSATSISLTFTGTALLSTSAGDYPLDLDLNGERVTITSAPAGGTSPRTVTVTRGVAPTVARAHSAGEAIDVWNAARIAL